MFRNIVYSVCCAIVLLGGIAVVEDVSGMEIIEYPVYLDNGTNILYQRLPRGFKGDYFPEYNDDYTGFSTCETDGRRFLTESFIAEYKKNRFARIDDGRPELVLWFHYLIEFRVFENWSIDDRHSLSRFIESMIAVFSAEPFRERDVLTKLEHVSSAITEYDFIDSI